MNYLKPLSRKQSSRAFTLVEIMVVVVIVGILATMAGQGYTTVRRASISTMLANNFSKYSDAFHLFSLEMGYWPEDSAPGTLPPGMIGRLTNSPPPASVQGAWDWNYQSGGYTSSLALIDSNADTDIMTRVDEKLDDGNLATGNFIRAGNSYIFILEP